MRCVRKVWREHQSTCAWCAEGRRSHRPKLLSQCGHPPWTVRSSGCHRRSEDTAIDHVPAAVPSAAHRHCTSSLAALQPRWCPRAGPPTCSGRHHGWSNSMTLQLFGRCTTEVVTDPEIPRNGHLAISSNTYTAIQRIVIGPVSEFVCVCVCRFICVWVFYHNNSILRASIFIKLGF